MYFNWTFDGNSVVNQSKLNDALMNLVKGDTKGLNLKYNEVIDISESNYIIGLKASTKDYDLINKNQIALKSDLANYFTYFGCKVWAGGQYSGRDIFYELRDEGILFTDSNGALAYVIGNINGTPFNNVYQENGIRYFRQDGNVVGQVQWNDDGIVTSEIRILYVKDKA